MAHLITAVMASAMLGIVSVPIAQLSVGSVQTQARSELHRDAERQALEIRKAAAKANDLEVSGSSLLLDGASYNLPANCNVAMPGTIATVTCSSSRGNGALIARSTQPLYAANDFTGQGDGSLCWSGYQSQSASDNNDRDTTFVTDILTFNAELSKPGNSGWGFVQIHTMDDPDCQSALANGGTLNHKGSGSNNNGNSGQGNVDNTDDDDDLCVVPSLIGQPFESKDADDEVWNTEGDGEFKFNNWKNTKKEKRTTVVSMNPQPGSRVDCDSDLQLNF